MNKTAHRVRVSSLLISSLSAALAFGVDAQAQQAAQPATAPSAVATAAPEVTPAAAPGPEAAPAQPAAVAPAVAPAAAPAPAAASAPAPLTRRELRRMPKRLRYVEGQPVPEGYVVAESSSKGLVIGGIAALAAPYVAGLVTAAIFGFGNEGGYLAVPVAGPWITWGLRDYDCFDDYCSSADSAGNRTINTMLVADGILQGAGTAMLVAGLLITRTDLIRIDLAKVQVVPTRLANGTYGLMAAGTF